MPEFHRQVLDAALEVGPDYGLVLAGGYAMRAHGLVDRQSQDLDFATFSTIPLETIAADLAATYRAAGPEIEKLRGTPLLARLLVTDPTTGHSCAVDLMKMPLQRPPVMLEICPVASLDDIVGMKVAALHGRSVPRDLVDLSSVADRYGSADLERLGALFDDEFRLETLALQLEAGLAYSDDVFADYGLDEVDVRRIRRFLLGWYDDLSMRLAEAAHLAGEQ